MHGNFHCFSKCVHRGSEALTLEGHFDDVQYFALVALEAVLTSCDQETHWQLSKCQQDRHGSIVLSCSSPPRNWRSVSAALFDTGETCLQQNFALLYLQVDDGAGARSERLARTSRITAANQGRPGGRCTRHRRDKLCSLLLLIFFTSVSETRERMCGSCSPPPPRPHHHQKGQ